MTRYLDVIILWILRHVDTLKRLRKSTYGQPMRVSGHHLPHVNDKTVYVVGLTDDRLLVRCWLPDVQLEVNLNPALLID